MKRLYTVLLLLLPLFALPALAAHRPHPPHPIHPPRPTQPADPALSYSGRAFGAEIQVKNPQPNTLTFSDTGQLPSGGGALHADLATISVGGTLSSSTVVADCSGGSDNANSSASQQNVSVFPLQPAALTASVVASTAHADCAGVSGSSVVTNLVFAGNSVVVTGAANQTVTLGALATLVINEQVVQGLGITVNALHLTLGTGESVILSSAHSDVTCGLVPVKPTYWGAIKLLYR